ncbi:sulfatase family protein [Paenibacillus cremeus]|nr:sulfatase-like hydrolase/transferase [Paenibacillus cremeus]
MKPNIILVMTDQQRADVSAREGFPLDTTPFMDSLARQGVWFDKAYTTSPICVAARCSLLTGRYPSAHRVRENGGVKHIHYTQDLFGIMKEQGYSTGLIGKNHSYLKPDDESVDYYYPMEHYGAAGPLRNEDERTFIEWLGRCSVNQTEPTPFPVECQNPYRGVTEALDWIEEVKENPFFLWLSFPEPHNPYQAPEPYYSMFPPDSLPPLQATTQALETKGFKWQWCRTQGEHFNPNFKADIDRVRSNYFGMLRLIDDQLRRLVTSLEEQGLMANTMLVFVSDHGDFVGEYGLIKKGPELPDILLRIPMFWFGPGIQRNDGPHAAHVSLADIMPTLCEAIGADIPIGVQGRSLWPMLTGQDYPVQEFSSVYGEHGFGGLEYSEDDHLDISRFGKRVETEQGTIIRFDELNTVTQAGFMRTIRKGDWKLNMSMQGTVQLYRISEDPLELNNRIGDPETKEMETMLLRELVIWMMRSQDPLPLPGQYSYKRAERNYLAPYSTHG